MAKSPTEQFRELSIQIGILMERDATRQNEIEELKAVIEKERDVRQSKIKELKAVIEKERDARAAGDRENAALKQQLQDHIVLYQEWDR